MAVNFASNRDSKDERNASLPAVYELHAAWRWAGVTLVRAAGTAARALARSSADPTLVGAATVVAAGLDGAGASEGDDELHPETSSAADTRPTTMRTAPTLSRPTGRVADAERAHT